MAFAVTGDPQLHISSDLEVMIALSTKLRLYNTHPANNTVLSECWSLSKADASKIDALH